MANKKGTGQKQKKTVRKKSAKRNNAAVNESSVSPAAPEEKPLKSAAGDFYIVGIGASAGGLDAFEQFFTHMPADSSMAFVLVPHLDPTHKSIMVELLQRYTKMAIFQAKDGLKVRPNHVYIIPPNSDISILHGVIHLLAPAQLRGIRHPIDFFFRALAVDRKEKAICIILSGTGTEGALGLKAVKGEGGLVLAQDPKTARYDGMPSSAIATGLVDYVLPPEKMPERLLDYMRRPYISPLISKGAPAGKAADMIQKIHVMIRAQTGHDFSLYKQNTILRRIERRMAIHQLETLSDYVTYLRSNPEEVEALLRELLIRVTSFFRDPDAFEIIRTSVLPLIFKDRPADLPVRIWVPGCSTGEEAYSLAMVVQEYMHDLKERFKVQIFATDIDRGAIDMARAGTYAESISVDVSLDRLKRFFIGKDSVYRAKDELREMIVFAVQDLIKDPPFTRLDMISCRNLLIYLGAELQKKVLPLFHYALNPGGILFLGSSETIGVHSDLFSMLDKKWKIYRTRKTIEMREAAIELRPALPPIAANRRAGALEIKRPGDLNIGQMTEKILLKQYAPSCVIVNEEGVILYFHGRTGKYLEPASGKAELNVIEMAREGLRFELRTALRKAAGEKKDVLLEGLQVKTNGGYQSVNLEVKYITEPEPLQGLIMVVFREAPSPRGRSGRPPLSMKKDTQLAEMEFELKSTRERLQSTIEELETSTEELKSSNEELLSANEELQSTNEEMETSKEELQSVNEELMTVNAELQNKIDELSQSNNDMANLLASTQIGTLFLDKDLRIKRFTPAMTGVANLIQTDVGRPLSDIASKLEYPELKKDMEEVLRTLVSKERMVRHSDGLWYLSRIMPYRTADNIIEGLVITFIDITAQQTAEEALRKSMIFEGIVQTVREPIMVLDGELRVMAVNRSFCDTFRMTTGEAEGRLVYELGDRQWDIPALRKLLEKILPESTQFNDFEVAHEFKGIGKKTMLLNARKIYQPGDEAGLILLAMEDVTGKEKEA